MTTQPVVETPAARPASGPASASPVDRPGRMRVLIATDSSAEAAKAMTCIQHLPLPAGSAMRVVSVVPGAEFPYPDWGNAVQQRQAACPHWTRRIILQRFYYGWRTSSLSM